MGSIIKSISIDEETLNILDEKKKDNPDFNLSEYIRKSLLVNSPTNNHLPIEVIEKNLREAEAKIELAKINKQKWEETHKNYLIQEELKNQEKLRQLEIEENEREKESEKRRIIKETFREEMNREMTDFELEEYLKEGKNIWGFCDMLKERKNR